MGGFVSTSLNMKESITHAFKNSDPAMKPVLMHISWKHWNGEDAFRLNTSDYSAMPQEKEILLNDGVEFRIDNVTDNYQVTDKKGKKHLITLIKLAHGR